jgi:hypothetical protein
MALDFTTHVYPARLHPRLDAVTIDRRLCLEFFCGILLENVGFPYLSDLKLPLISKCIRILARI